MRIIIGRLMGKCSFSTSIDLSIQLAAFRDILTGIREQCCSILSTPGASFSSFVIVSEDGEGG